MSPPSAAHVDVGDAVFVVHVADADEAEARVEGFEVRLGAQRDAGAVVALGDSDRFEHEGAREALSTMLGRDHDPTDRGDVEAGAGRQDAGVGDERAVCIDCTNRSTGCRAVATTICASRVVRRRRRVREVTRLRTY